MVSKQLPWRRSNVCTLFILSFLSCSTPILSMHDTNDDPRTWRSKLISYVTDRFIGFNNGVLPVVDDSVSLPVVPEQELVISDRPRQLTEQEKENYRFHGHTWHQMMQAYQAAPWEVHHIVEHLNNPELFGDDDYRAVIFVGAPGSGKTTTAKAVAHVANWFCKFITSSEMEGMHRNETANNLLKTLYSVAQDRHRKTIVVIDELEEFLENFESDKYDTKATGVALRTFLDRQAGNRNFFLIGTMNRDTKIEQPLKNRFESDRIVFQPIIDHARKRAIFKDQLLATTMQLHQECDDVFFDSCVKMLGDVTPRTYQNIRKKVSRVLWHEAPQNRIIRACHITQAICDVLQARNEMEYHCKLETDQERQERHHKENLELQTLHHIQSTKINLAIQNRQKGQWNVGVLGLISRSTAHGLGTTDMNEILDKNISAEQQEIYAKYMRKKYTKKPSGTGSDFDEYATTQEDVQ